MHESITCHITHGPPDSEIHIMSLTLLPDIQEGLRLLLLEHERVAGGQQQVFSCPDAALQTLRTKHEPCTNAHTACQHAPRQHFMDFTA